VYAVCSWSRGWKDAVFATCLFYSLFALHR
jgi:hypothetical protein